MTEEPRFQKQFLCPKYWGIWFLLGLLRGLHCLPYRLRFRLGAWLGRTLGRFAKKRARIVEANLAIAFPEKTSTERQQIATQHFESLGISLFESMLVWWGDYRRHPDTAFEKGLVNVVGLEHLRAAEATGKGVIILTPHFTTTDIIGTFISFSTSLSAVYRPHDNPLMNYLIAKGRSQSVKPISKYNLREMVKSLKQGENLGFLPDQRYRAKGKVDVPFFGVKAPSNPATSKLCKLTGALVVPTFLTRDKHFHYTLEFLPALENFPSQSDEEDTLRLHQIYENQIRKNPAQYLWVHNRWNIKVPKKSSNRSD